MFTRLILSIAILCLSCSEAKRILEIQAKTSTEPSSGTNDFMSFGFFAAEHADHCRILSVDSAGDDFEPGHTDVFEGTNLGGCALSLMNDVVISKDATYKMGIISLITFL